MTHARPACDAKNCAVSNANQCESGACRWDFGGKSMTPTNAQDLHAQIMNLTCNYPVGNAREYREGYRDARHAAAELVSAQAEQADAQIARFVAAVNVQTAEIERLRDVIERLSAVVNAAQAWSTAADSGAASRLTTTRCSASAKVVRCAAVFCSTGSRRAVNGGNDDGVTKFLARRLAYFFDKNPDEVLTTWDIADKFGADRKKVPCALDDAVRRGWFARVRGGHKGNPSRYSRGPTPLDLNRFVAGVF